MIKNKNFSLDVLKFVLAIIIVLHHIWCNFYVDYISMKYLSGGRLAVDVFFIISGFLLMNSVFSKIGTTSSQNYKNYVFSRIKRLYPEFLFVMVITVLLNFILDKKFDYGLIIPNIFFFARFCGVDSIVRDPWFVSCLFWCSIFLVYIIYNSKNYLFYIIIMTIISYFIIYSVYKHIGVNAFPLFMGFISPGVFRCILGLGCGIITYIMMSKITFKINKSFASILELTILIYIIYLFAHGNKGQEQMNIFFTFPFILIMLWNKQSIFYKILNKNIKISNISYMLFLSHLMIIENIIIYKEHILKYNEYAIVLLLTLLCIFVAFLLSNVFFQSKKLFLSIIPNLITEERD